MSPHRPLFVPFVALLAIGCSKNTDVDELLRELPAWETFSPPLADVAPQPVPDVEPTVFSEPGEHTIISYDDTDGGDAVETETRDVVYRCSTVPYTMTSTPQQIVMFNPDVELLWPGALLQGKSHRDGVGLGSLDALPITKRSPLEVSIPAVAAGGNFRLVEQPTQAQVASAIGEIVGDAVAADVVTPSTITFKEKTYNSESEFALSFDVSGRYYGFEGSATGDIDRSQSRTTIAAEFFQRMYEVVVAPPETPSAVFSDDFTIEDYEAQRDLGRIGDDNLPIYVSNVVYGRMMTFSMTSTASEEEMRATLSASYNALVGGVEASLSARQKTILQESEIAVSSLGGNAEATIAMIKSGNWREYFSEDSPLSSAAPLSYTFRNLGDNSIAFVSESTEYDITSCVARTVGDIFDFVEVQEHESRLPAGYQAMVGDFDGDGFDDLVWNHRDGDDNLFYIGYGSVGGVLELSEPIAHPDSPNRPWSNFDLHIGDFDGDGSDDLLWNDTGPDHNEWAVARSTSSGFVFDPIERHPTGRDWRGAVTVVADLDGDGKDDIVFNDRSTGTDNYAYPIVDFVVGQGFEVRDATLHSANNGWEHYETLVGDVDLDGDDDLWFSRLDDSAGNRSWMMIAEDDGVTSLNDGADTLSQYTDVWGAYVPRMGDVNADGRADGIYVRNDGGVYIGLAQGCTPYCDGDALEQQPFSFAPLFAWEQIDVVASAKSAMGLGVANRLFWSAHEPLTGDVDGDGRTDIIWHAEWDRAASVVVAFSRGSDNDHSLDRAADPQLNPWSVPSWEAFEDVLTGDFDGDGRTDLVWNQTAATNRISLALAAAEL